MLVPHGAIVLVVDGGRLRLLRNRGRDAAPQLMLIEERDIKNPSSRAHGTERPGRAFESAGIGRHAYAAEDYHQRREGEFAATAYACVSEHPDAPVIVIAPPRMMGVIRDFYSNDFRQRLVAELDKDLTDSTPAEIVQVLQRHRE